LQDCGESFQNGHEKPLDCGVVQGRKKITPDVLSKLTMTNVQQGEKCNKNRRLETSHEGETMMSSMLGLLDLLDYQSTHDTKPLSEMCTSWKSPHDGKNSLCINYFPAGASLKAYNGKSKNLGVINSTSLRDKDRHTSGERNGSYSVQFKETRKLDSSLGMILPDHTTALLDNERKEMQSSAVKHSEHFEKTVVEKQCRSLSLLECLQGKMNSVSENGSCRTEKSSCVQQDATEEEITSTSTRNCFQDIVNSVAISTKTNRRDLLGDIKNTLSQSSIPDMKAVLPQAASKATLQLETPGNDKRAKSVNSLAR
jgi:hypothetical protein